MNDRTEYYRQCILQKGSKIQTVWIPEKFAVVDTFIKLKTDDGWKVKAVSTNREPYSFLRDYARQDLPSLEK